MHQKNNYFILIKKKNFVFSSIICNIKYLMFNYFFKHYTEFNILSLNQAFINKKQQKPSFEIKNIYSILSMFTNKYNFLFVI